MSNIIVRIRLLLFPLKGLLDLPKFINTAVLRLTILEKRTTHQRFGFSQLQDVFTVEDP